MSDLVSLSKLFENKFFRIPDYQRGYAWKESQLNDFWDDLYNLAPGKFHYTGMLSLKALKESETIKYDDGEKWLMSCEYQPYHIVDGQQRLTTAIILISSILEIAKQKHLENFNGISVDSLKEKYIVITKQPTGLLKAYRFGYECDNPSFKYLRYKIMGEDYSGTIDESFYTLNLEFAKTFFDNKLKEVLEIKGINEIINLFSKLTNKLQFNTYYIDDDFDVCVAFETMNNRGKKLSNLEILKNRLIYLTIIYPDKILSLSEKNALRDNINDTWREVYFQLGRNKDQPLDDDEYLKNHWTLFYKYTRKKGDDYIQFLLNDQFTSKAVIGEDVELLYSRYSNIEEAQEKLYDNDHVLVPKEIMDYVNSLKEVAKYWYFSYSPADNKDFSNDEIKWLKRLNHIGINYFRILVVSAMLNKSVTQEERIVLYKTIERFIFIYFRLAKNNSNYDSVDSYKYARELYKNNVNIKEIIKFFDDEIQKNLSISLESFKTEMNRLFTNNDGFYSWDPLKYFLFEYEAKLSEGRKIAKLDDWEAFTKSIKDKISIEHIFPQKPSAYSWRNSFRKYSNELEQHRLANSLGNLLVLSQSINSSLQNYSFETKKADNLERNGYANGSYSEMEVAKFNDWTPDTIYSRGMKLLSFMEERWNFKFSSEEFKKSVLGLEFLFDNRDDVPKIVDCDHSGRDTFYSGKVGEVKVSEYLKNIDIYLVEYYDSLFDTLKKSIPSLYEVVIGKDIILKCKESTEEIVRVRLQNGKHKICIYQNMDKRKTSKENIFIKEGEDFSKIIDEIIFKTNI